MGLDAWLPWGSGSMGLDAWKRQQTVALETVAGGGSMRHGRSSCGSLLLIIAHFGSFRLTIAHYCLLLLIIAHLGSFRLITAHSVPTVRDGMRQNSVRFSAHHFEVRAQMTTVKQRLRLSSSTTHNNTHDTKS